MNPTQPIASVLGVARRAAADPLRLPARAAQDAVAVAGAMAAWASDQVSRHVDLTPLVKQIVDLDSLISDVDIDAVTDRLDLVALVETVIAEIDLPAIIRDSTGSVASSTVRGVRMQSVSGDEAIARAVDRLRLRGRHRPVPEPRADGVT